MKKHFGKLKSTGKRIVVVFRYMYDENGNIVDDTHALVVDTDILPTLWADAFMDAVNSTEGQDTIDFFNVAARKTLPDGRFILPALQQENRLLKVRSSDIIMEPENQTKIPLDELNRQIKLIESGKTDDDVGTMTSDRAIQQQNARHATKEKVTFSSGTEDAKLRALQIRAHINTLKNDISKLEKEADELDPLPKRSRGRPKKIELTNSDNVVQTEPEIENVSFITNNEILPVTDNV